MAFVKSWLAGSSSKKKSTANEIADPADCTTADCNDNLDCLLQRMHQYCQHSQQEQLGPHEEQCCNHSQDYNIGRNKKEVSSKNGKPPKSSSFNEHHPTVNKKHSSGSPSSQVPLLAPDFNSTLLKNGNIKSDDGKSSTYFSTLPNDNQRAKKRGKQKTIISATLFSGSTLLKTGSTSNSSISNHTSSNKDCGKFGENSCSTSINSQSGGIIIGNGTSTTSIKPSSSFNSILVKGWSSLSLSKKKSKQRQQEQHSLTQNQSQNQNNLYHHCHCNSQSHTRNWCQSNTINSNNRTRKSAQKSAVLNFLPDLRLRRNGCPCSSTAMADKKKIDEVNSNGHVIGGFSTNQKAADRNSDTPSALSNMEKDFEELERALRLLADDDQPIVARSTPRNAAAMMTSSHPNPIGQENAAAAAAAASRDRTMQHCLYEKPVYDSMIADSLKIVEMLQENLDSFVNEVQQNQQQQNADKKSVVEHGTSKSRGPMENGAKSRGPIAENGSKNETAMENGAKHATPMKNGAKNCLPVSNVLSYDVKTAVTQKRGVQY